MTPAPDYGIPDAPEIGGLEGRRVLGSGRPFSSVPDPGHTLTQMGYGPFKDNNDPIVESRRRLTEGGGSSETLCQFGQVFDDGGTYKLRGGTVYAGPAIHSIAHYAVPTVDGTYKLWLAVTAEANEADGVLLPGIASSSAAVIDDGVSYPSNFVPTVADPDGDAIVALGELVVSGTGTVFDFTAARSSCGAVVLGYCPGNPFLEV